MAASKTSVKKGALTGTPVASAKAPEETTEATEIATGKKKPSKPKVRKAIDPNLYVSVKNGFHGSLFYKDTTTGEEHRWSEFGDEIEMTFGSLQRARSAQRKFFTENWWLIDDQEVLEALNATQYYKNALTYEDFEDLFSLKANKVKDKVSGLSRGQKRGVVYVAKQKIEDGELADLNVIRALEEALGTELIYK